MPSPELALELLIARPRASDDLRERVRAVAAQAEPRREHRFAVPPLRRFALVAAATAIAVSCVAAAVYGIANSGGRERGAAKSSAASGGALQPQVPKGVLVNPGVERAAQIPA